MRLCDLYFFAGSLSKDVRMSMKNRKFDTINEEIIDATVNEETEPVFTSQAIGCNKNELFQEYLSGNWQTFFNNWDKSFSPKVRILNEYRVLTLKLRIHFAVLPVRVEFLHQHVDNESSEFNRHVTQILRNGSLINFQRNRKSESTEWSVKSMKQLEYYLNSNDGQILSKELENTSLIKFFALPYILNPHEDESISSVFSIKWLEALTVELEKFLDKYLPSDSESEKLSNTENEKKTYSVKSIDGTEEISDACHGTSCNRDDDMHMVNKKQDIEGWIAQQQLISAVDDKSFSTKSSQTYISGLESSTMISKNDTSDEVAETDKKLAANNELNSIKSKLFEVYKHYKKLKVKFHKLHEDYQKLNEVAEVLTIALENSVKGQPVKLGTILHSCINIFPNRFRRDLPEIDSEDSTIDLKYLPVSVPSESLDYKKIKLHLKSSNVRTKLLLLQALRQKITLSPPEDRDVIVLNYMNNDLLGLFGDVSLGIFEENILRFILKPLNTIDNASYLQQTTARLLNALASLNSGRNYLTTSPKVLNAIIKYLDSLPLNGSHGDSCTLDMLLATLQKMSLRKQQRVFMVEANLIEWLLHHLASTASADSDDICAISAYRLEYTAALLMNLSLQSEARARASALSPVLISTLKNLLSLDRKQLIPYANGALQNFLLHNVINEAARNDNLADFLNWLYEQVRAEFRDQILRTLRIHLREHCNDLSDDEDEDDLSDEDDAISDILENELEENDPIKRIKDELCGEQLLALSYSKAETDFDKKKLPARPPLPAPNSDTLQETCDVQPATASAAVDVAAARATLLSTSSETTREIHFKTENSKTKEKISAIPADKSSDEKSFADEINVFQAKPRIMRTPPGSFKRKTTAVAAATVEEKEKLSEIT
ncbi:hypothetical protein TKK_0012819 [Trichogramma kaykai]|uniref:LisH domain-containing protein ARMC9 n=1 Tax=Trichogramma kaykai TaxID=54128 RepID=A0ABD2WKU8_9HYME